MDGLWAIHGLADQVTAEALRTALDAYDRPDPAGTPLHERRAPGQRRADALGRLVRSVLDAGLAPCVGGYKPHLLAVVDLATLVGADDAAVRTPRLRWTGALHPEQARRLARDARLTAIATLGPWRAVNVGRSARTLPAWLRPALEMIHRHCRGPDCDRPVVWADAHHETAWEGGGETDLNATIPLCRAHHSLVTSGQWQVRFDPHTGHCTWTSRAGGVRVVPPSPP